MSHTVQEVVATETGSGWNTDLISLCNGDVALAAAFGNLHYELYAKGIYDEALAVQPSEFMQHKRGTHDRVVSAMAEVILAPTRFAVERGLERALADGRSVVFRQQRFAALDATSFEPRVRTFEFVKSRTQKGTDNSVTSSYADRGTNSAAEAELTPRFAQLCRAGRLDELRVDGSMVGYRPELAKDVMYKAVVVAHDGPYESREANLRLVASWLVGQSRTGAGATSPAAYAYARRTSNDDIDPGLWMVLENTVEQFGRQEYYDLITSTFGLVPNIVLDKLAGSVNDRLSQMTMRALGAVPALGKKVRPPEIIEPKSLHT